MTADTTTRRRPWLPSGSTVGGFVVCAVVAGSFAPYTWPMRVATAAVCAAVALDAVRRGRVRGGRDVPVPNSAGTNTAALAVWLVLIAMVVVVQMAMYLSAPRETYPTLSSLASDAFAWRPVRVGAFGLWMWVGWYLVRR